MVGKTLAHYTISTQLGKGGMGEVYQAKDTKLGRDVAIKVLPEEFAMDGDRVARFQREAKLLASLNHPNIAAIYGLEESDGTHFLVMELIEGDTLADRLKRGPIPVEKALELGLRIAEALEAAHEKGIIHRDLKPANVMITPEEKIKILDFGLAKAFAGDPEDGDPLDSPTLSVAATQKGVILGTAAYMSPEQARGKAVDKRTDIWAFGVVLYEMLTGRSLFAGEDVSSTLAKVLEREPDFSTLPENLHFRIRLLFERCLNKEPKNRYHDIADARVDIQDVLDDPSGVLAQPGKRVEPGKKLKIILPWTAVTAIVCLIIAGVAVWKFKPTEPKRIMRFTHHLPEGQQFVTHPNRPAGKMAVSPDGGKFVYPTTEGLYLRSIDGFEAELIAGTDKGSQQPFFSPNGQYVGYVSSTDGKLKKISISGGAPVVLCDISPLIVGASWDLEDTIVYSDYARGGVFRVSADGGTPESLFKGMFGNIEEGFPAFPQMLPDGKSVLFINAIDLDSGNMQIMVCSLESGERKVLIKGGGHARYLDTGHIVYQMPNSNNLLAVPFDLKRLEVTGDTASILEGVQNPAFSDSGVMVYLSQAALAAGSDGTTRPSRNLVWVDRNGKETPLAAEPDEYRHFKISPDGTRVALTIGSGPFRNIWTWDFFRETMTRLTFTDGIDAYPLWTPDSQRVIYTSNKESTLPNGIWWKKADGMGEVEKLYSEENVIIYPFSSSKDGKTLALWMGTLTPMQADIAALSMEGDHAKMPLLQEKYNELYPQISPDGRWIAYQSDESGRYEVYVNSFPDVNQGRWQVSANGGGSPLWSPDGRELFYHNNDSFIAVAVETDPAFKPGKSTVLFTGTYVYDADVNECVFWDIHPDGKRFLMLKPPTVIVDETAVMGPRKINIVLNWDEELKKRVPVE